VSYSWEESGSPIASGVSPSISLAVGSHTITLIVTDDDGATDSDEVVVTVQSGASTSDFFVNDIDGSGSSAAGGNWTATAVYYLVDGVGGAVANATVTVEWTGPKFKTFTESAVTGADGSCSFSQNFQNNNASATCTIINATHSTLTYNAAANSDAEGDSDGTSIVLSKL
jgi:hypothetical protein